MGHTTSPFSRFFTLLRRLTLLSAASLVLPFSFSVEGQIVNGGFETGTLAGWAVAGQGTVHDATFGVTPTHGSYAGYIENTGNGTVLAGDMELDLHLPIGSVTNLVPGTPTRGTVMWQNVVAVAGQSLAFDWNFMSDELNEDPVYNDYAFFSVVGATSGVTDLFLLASRNSSSFPLGAPAGFDGSTGWFTQNYTFSASDTYRVGFGVMNVTDSGHNSALMLDGIVVPEPSATALLALFSLLGSKVAIQRRQRV